MLSGTGARVAVNLTAAGKVSRALRVLAHLLASPVAMRGKVCGRRSVVASPTAESTDAFDESPWTPTGLGPAMRAHIAAA